MTVVVLQGSSILANWSNAKADLALEEETDIVNRAVGGTTSYDLLANMPSAAPLNSDSASEEVWVCYSGSNDLIWDVQVEEVLANFASYLERVPDKSIKIIFCSLLRSPDRAHIYSEVDTFNRELAALASRSNEARKGGSAVSCLASYVDINPGLNESHYLDDGIHLTSEGYRVMGETLGAALRKESH